MDLQIELFNKLVRPILLYYFTDVKSGVGGGAGNTEIIERVQLKFLKQILHLKNVPQIILYTGKRVFFL